MKNYRPLAGLRVLSFEGWVSLPSATRLLADLGADVVRVQQPRTGEGATPLDRFAEQADLAINKRSLPLDLTNPQAREVALRLALQADVVCNNFRPGVMERYGLGWKELSAAKPSLIVAQITGYGATGPWSQLPALGPSVEAAGGMNTLIGQLPEVPMRVGGSAYADVASGRYMILGVLAALRRRAVTGEGSYVDLSMYETIVHLLGDRTLGSAATGLRHERAGNRSAMAAPQNIYRSSGRDEWIAISVTSDVAWQHLVAVVGDDALRAPEYATLEGRRAAADDIDAAIEAWTSDRSKFEVSSLLQAANVAAGPVSRPADIPVDPQYEARQFFQLVPHGMEVLGAEEHAHMSLGWRVRGYARPQLRPLVPDPSPDWAVLTDWLGMDTKDVRDLAEQGAIRGAAQVTGRRGRRAKTTSWAASSTSTRVLDLGSSIAGQFATLLMAESGYDVVRVEFTGLESPAAAVAPEHLLYDYLNRRKHVVTIDPATEDGQATLRGLIANASCIVEDHGPTTLDQLGLSVKAIKRLNAQAIVTSISSFGLNGPRSEWQANDFIVQCMGGLVWGTGWDGERPYRLPDHQAQFIGGLNAALASMVALLTDDGRGCQIDLSMQEVFAQQWAREVMRYVYAGRPYRRESRGAGRQGFPHTAMAKDGWLYLLATGATWETVALFLGLTELITEEWSDSRTREERWDEIDAPFRATLTSHTKYEWVAGAAEQRLQFAPIDDPLDVLDSPQLNARHFFRDAQLQSGEIVPCPSLPFPVPAPTTPNRIVLWDPQHAADREKVQVH